MNHAGNATAILPSTFPGATAQGQSSASHGPVLRTELPWLPDARLSCSPHGDDNGWRGIHTRRNHLSRDAVVARIRSQLDPSLLHQPKRPDAAPVLASTANLGQAMLKSMHNLLASMPTLRIGPAGADAATAVGTAVRPAADRVSYFIKRFEKAFDIRKTSALAGNADLSGVTLVIGGEGDSPSADMMRALTHLRRENGDRLLMEGLSQASRWTGPTCDRFDAALRGSCVPIEAGCAASESYYAAMDAYQVAVHESCAFILGNLSVFRPDIKVELPRNIDQCVETSGRYADIVASFKPDGMQHHAMQIARALKYFKDVERQTTVARQAHMLERIRQPIAKGAARFVIVSTDFLADLVPQLLSEGKVILMMPAEMVGSNARYRMPYAAQGPQREEL